MAELSPLLEIVSWNITGRIKNLVYVQVSNTIAELLKGIQQAPTNKRQCPWNKRFFRWHASTNLCFARRRTFSTLTDLKTLLNFYVMLNASLIITCNFDLQPFCFFFWLTYVELSLQVLTKFEPNDTFCRV